MTSTIDGFVESRGVKLHYLMANSEETNKPSLLFVPGLMMPAWIWKTQLEYFSRHYRVVAMDPRSQGGSDRSSEGLFAFALAEDIKAIVDALKLKPLILIGWSIGVPQVINYAAHFGADGLIGLVLVDGIAGIDPSLPFYQSMVDEWVQFQMDRIPKTKEFVKKIFKQPQPEIFYEKLFKEALLTPTNTVMNLIDNYILQDFRALLPVIEIPVLMMTVEGPRLNYMQKTSTLFPQCHLEIIKDAGHALFVDQPEMFNRLLEEFIVDILCSKKCRTEENSK